MASLQDWQALLTSYFRFSEQELRSLLLACVVSAFIFSFSFPGESYSVLTWAWFFVLALIVSLVSIFTRLSVQKAYALKNGYALEFEGWNLGLFISALLTLVSLGSLPLLLFGRTHSSFMARSRIGEFRYGFSHSENAGLHHKGLLTSIVLATCFAVGRFVFAGGFFFEVGVLMNLVIAFSALLPLPWMEGLEHLFLSRPNYYYSIAIFFAATLLLFLNARWSLVLLLFIEAIGAIGTLLWSA